MDISKKEDVFKEPIKAIIVGAGRRGIDIFGEFSKRNPNLLSYVAVVEPNKKRRDYFGDSHNINPNRRFNSLNELFKKKQEVKVAINATNDKSHYETTELLLQNGFHVLLEKPIATTYEECEKLEKVALQNKRILMICHVLRYSPFFKKLKNLINSNEIGKLKKIDLIENIGHSHFVHSYVRGNWNNSKTSGPISLTKTSHDFDIIAWLLDFEECTDLFSYSTKISFSKENAPGKVPTHCLKGCDFQENCRYYAPNYYLNPKVKNQRKRAVSINMSQNEIKESLKEGQYGRCVYRCDNDVPETQITTMQFSNNAVANLIMSSDQEESTRRIKIKGEKRTIEGTLVEGELIIKKNNETTKKIKISMENNSHGGGDFPLIYDFLIAIKKSINFERTSVTNSLFSHKLAFEAEKSRQDYILKIKKFILKNKDYLS